ncbi:SCD domain-containing protein [Mycena indigotica]|uniref:SCD domain-containing protein n=1 Tax=Mycena indigotica TaxID=2126181 RepID=A0A8H6VT05_9AGAR|nr:SCD domain-containing protein [Mycena indigotica]KAF7292892.1 SCD domain-containing protein [Mycena indigotica]
MYDSRLLDAMSSAAVTPRRSQRERKVIPSQPQDDDDDDQDVTPPTKSGKRKRAVAADSDADEEGHQATKRKTKRKPVKEKEGKKVPRKTARRVKTTGDDAFDPKQAAKESNINTDNPLFNAILNPAAALQSTSEDFLESLTESPGLALAEIVNMVLRCCGCNATMDADRAVDYDGVVDALDDVTEDLKKDPATTSYPLISKLPLFKKFRKSLREFLERLIASAADLGPLYTSDLVPTLQAWVIAMSSSQIRSFRHTATVVALELESALCDVAARVEKEAELSARQREGEKKRKGVVASDKGHDAKAAQIRQHREKLAEFLKEGVDGVFVHRYRDLDPLIRADCTEALGIWFSKHPAHFLDATYLRYIGWVLSDKATPVRLAALHALEKVYAQSSYAPNVHHFTERFKGRLLEMAARDVDSGVRVAVLGVIEAIGISELEDDERETVALCVFDIEPRVRKAVGGFVRACWEEIVDERLVGRAGRVTDEERSRAGVKALSTVLVRWGLRLDADPDEEQTEADEDRRPVRPKEPNSLTAATHEERMGRAGIVVEALWNEVEAVSDWETILNVLLLDHSSADEDSSNARKQKVNGKSKASEDGLVDEAWRLEEDEETVLIEVLVASLKYAKEFAKKGDEESLTNDITRALIKGLPRLLVKYQTDQSRLTNVLTIPTFMNLDLYLEMRMVSAYSSLWDDIMKQFLSHSDPIVLSVAAQAMMYLFSATSLSNTNSTKILELEDEMASALRDAVSGRDEIDIAGFDEDEMITLGALCMRISLLFGSRDLSSWLEEDEGGKQSSISDIVSALVDRGKLGYKEEAFMITQALEILHKHLVWKMRHLKKEKQGDERSPEDTRFREKLEQQRNSLLERCEEYAVASTQSNTAILVSRTAFLCLINMHILFATFKDIPLSMNDETQFRCAGYMQAEIERYAETLAEEIDAEDAEKEDESGDEDNQQKTLKKKKNAVREVDVHSPAQLLTEYSFVELAVTFIQAVRTGVLNVQHSAVLLSQYGRLGATFDNFTKLIVETLREEGLEQDNGGDTVVAVVTQALQEAFGLVLDGLVADETSLVQLSKHLSQAFVLRGAHLAVLKRLEMQYVVQIQTTNLSWIIKKIGGFEANKNKHSLRTSITFFKALVPLLVGLHSRDAMKIKAHLDQALAQAKVDASSTSKIWEPLRAYEKRLAVIISKDKAPAKGGRKGKAAKGDAITSSEDETEISEVEKLVEDREPSPVRPKPRRLPRKPPVDGRQSSPEQDPEPPTPRPRPKPKGKSSQAQVIPPTQDSESENARSARRSLSSLSPPPDDPPPFETPSRSQKRARPTSDDEEDEASGGGSGPVADDDNSIPARQLTPAGDVQRRKRARH